MSDLYITFFGMIAAAGLLLLSLLFFKGKCEIRGALRRENKQLQEQLTALQHENDQLRDLLGISRRKEK